MPNCLTFFLAVQCGMGGGSAAWAVAVRHGRWQRGMISPEAVWTAVIALPRRRHLSIWAKGGQCAVGWGAGQGRTRLRGEPASVEVIRGRRACSRTHVGQLHQCRQLSLRTEGHGTGQLGWLQKMKDSARGAWYSVRVCFDTSFLSVPSPRRSGSSGSFSKSTAKDSRTLNP